MGRTESGLGVAPDMVPAAWLTVMPRRGVRLGILRAHLRYNRGVALKRRPKLAQRGTAGPVRKVCGSVILPSRAADPAQRGPHSLIG
jgi:hypothetical protein